MSSVNRDDEWKNKSHVPNHQPVINLEMLHDVSIFVVHECCIFSYTTGGGVWDICLIVTSAALKLVGNPTISLVSCCW